MTGRGIVLLSAVVLVLFASITILGVTFFLGQRLSQAHQQGLSHSNMYLAHAGINQAIYQFRSRDLAANGAYTMGQTTVEPGRYFVIGADASDRLMVNASGAVLSGNSRNLLNLSIQNATNSQTAVIDRMIVSWNNTRRLTRIQINGSTVWSGNATSPANVNITNFTLNRTPSIYPINELRFNGVMTGATITVQFVMTDGSSKTLQVYPGTNNNNFTVKATGKASGYGAYRTLQAEYNAITGRILTYREIDAEMTP